MGIKDMHHEVINRTADTLSMYQNNTEKKLILTQSDYVDKYPYDKTKLAGIFSPEDFGFHDRFMGGAIHRIAKVADTHYYILVDIELNTFAIFIPNENLKELTVSELKSICDKFKKEYSSDIRKDDLIKMLIDK